MKLRNNQSTFSSNLFVFGVPLVIFSSFFSSVILVFEAYLLHEILLFQKFQDFLLYIYQMKSHFLQKIVEDSSSFCQNRMKRFFVVKRSNHQLLFLLLVCDFNCSNHRTYDKKLSCLHYIRVVIYLGKVHTYAFFIPLNLWNLHRLVCQKTFVCITFEYKEWITIVCLFFQPRNLLLCWSVSRFW